MRYGNKPLLKSNGKKILLQGNIIHDVLLARSRQIQRGWKQMSNTLIILRGTPGSGKSFMAKKLVDDAIATDPSITTCICSADSFFIKDGQYKFDASKLGYAHESCKRQAHKAMENGVSLVIIDNTNTTKREYRPYLEIAGKFGYTIEEKIVGELDDESLEMYAKRNQHSVPLETIKRMAKRFEK